MASTRLYAEALETFQQEVQTRGKDSDTAILRDFLLDGGGRSSYANPEAAKKAALQLATDAGQKYGGISIGKFEVVPKKWIDNILGNVDSIIAVGNYAVKSAPESIGMVWFAVSLTLGAIRNNYNLYALFGQGLTDITEVMIIIVHYDRLYDERNKSTFEASDLVKKLFRDTITAYVAVLDFAFSVKKHMSGKAFDKVKHVFKDLFNAQEPKFRAKLENIAVLKSKILESSQGAFQGKTLEQLSDVQAALKQVQYSQSQGNQLQLEQHQMLEAMRDDFQQMRDVMKRKTPWEELKDEFMLVKNKLSPFPAARPVIEVLLARKHENTCTWVFENKDYRTWTTSGEQAMLCIIGSPGSGKSTVLASIAQQLQDGGTSKAILVNYVSCIGTGDSESADLEAQRLSRVLNTLVYQVYELAAQDGDKMSLLEDCNRIFRNSKREESGSSAQDDRLPDFVEAMERLIVALQRDVILILDAVGILMDNDQAELYNTLLKLVSNTSRPYKINILVGSHSNSRYVQLASNAAACIDLSQSNNNLQDMETVLDSYLRDLSGWSEREREEAKTVVLSKAGSTFSYLETVARPFLQQPFQRPLKAHLEKLPDSMNDSFDQALLAMPSNYFELLKVAVTYCLLSPRVVAVKEILELYSGTYDMSISAAEEDDLAGADSYNPKATALEIQQISAASGPFLAIDRTKDGQTLVKLQDVKQVKNFCLHPTKQLTVPQNGSRHICDNCKMGTRGVAALKIEPKTAHFELALAMLKHLNSPLFQKRFGLLQNPATVESADQGGERGGETTDNTSEAFDNGVDDDSMGETEATDATEEEEEQEPEVVPKSDDTGDVQIHETRADGSYTEDSIDEDSESGDPYENNYTETDHRYSSVYTRDSTLRSEIMDWPYHLREVERLWSLKEKKEDPRWTEFNKVIQQELRKFSSNQVVFENWQKLWEVDKVFWNLKKPISLAADLGLMAWVEDLLDSGVSIHTVSGWRNVAQCSGELAHVHQNIELLRMLLRRGANFTWAANQDAPALHIWLDLYGQEPSVVQAFVDHKVDFSSSNQHGWTGMHVFAWRSSDVKSFDLIMNASSKRPPINAEDNYGETPLFKLLWRTTVPLDLLQAFLAVPDIDINHDAHNSQQPLGLASKWGSLDIVRLLIARNAHLDDVDLFMRTALHKAATGGYTECMQALIDAGCQLELVDKGGYTPLQYAAYKGHESAVQLLISRGVDRNCIDRHNRNPLFNALNGQHNEQGAAIFLLTELTKANHSASEINRVTKGGRTPLRHAAFRGFTDVLKALLEYISCSDDADLKVVINQADKKLRLTPLHCAAIRGHPDCVRLLISYGADTKLKSKKKMTALQTAQDAWAQRNEKGFEEVVSLLIDADTETARSDTELPSIAAANDSVKILRRLHTLQADLGRTDRLGWTPIAHAKHSGNIAAERFLKHEITWASNFPSRWVDPDHVAVLNNSGLRVRREEGNEVSIVSDKPLPFDVERFYYEVTINTLHAGGAVAIGFCTLGASPHVFPGWLPKHDSSPALAWAYHGDDGCLYHKFPTLFSTPTGESYGAGDTVGCGIDSGLRKIWFTKNGSILPETFDDVKGRLFPILGLHDSVSLRTNFGRQPFMWKDSKATERADGE